MTTGRLPKQLGNAIVEACDEILYAPPVDDEVMTRATAAAAANPTPAPMPTLPAVPIFRRR